MKNFHKFFALGIIALGLTAVGVSAHSAGASIEKTIDNYLVDIGYSPEEPITGEPVRFDFALSDKPTEEEIDFTNIWVRIEEGNKSLFAGSIDKARFGLTGFLYAFPESGEYQIFSRFENNEGPIAETSFPFSIEAGPDEEKNGDFMPIILSGFALGILFFAIVNFLIKRGKR